MITIQQAVGLILKERVFLEESIHEGLINLSSLARELTPQVEKMLSKPIKSGAIVMALKRHRPGKLISINMKVQNLIENLNNIIVRLNISVFTFENSKKLYRIITELSKSLQQEKGLFFTFSYGVFETTLIVNSRVEDQIREMFKEEKLLSFQNHLASITLYLPGENTQITGYYYYILKQIAWQGINIQEVLSTTNEFSLIIHEKDVDSAFSALKSKS
jgi:aspartokinase